MEVGTSARIGGLVGLLQRGAISTCYVSGATVEGEGGDVGGLVGGSSAGKISTCYVLGERSTGGNFAEVGGLVGQQDNDTIRACYVSNITATGGRNRGSLFGRQNGTIIASYAGGKDYMIPLRGAGSGDIKNSYSQIATGGSNTEDETRKFEATLKNPTDYTGIYADWDDLDDNGSPDSETFWHFGGTSDYPKLKVDFNSNGTPTVAEFGSQ